MGPDAQRGDPAMHSGCMPLTLAQEKGQLAAQDSSSDLCAAVEQPLLVPCVRSDVASLAPAAAKKASTTRNETEKHQPQDQKQKNNRAQRSNATTSVSVAVSQHESSSQRQEGSVTCMIEASVRAGDWVLPDRGNISNFPGGLREAGWLRVEAVFRRVSRLSLSLSLLSI